MKLEKLRERKTPVRSGLLAMKIAILSAKLIPPRLRPYCYGLSDWLEEQAELGRLFFFSRDTISNCRSTDQSRWWNFSQKAIQTASMPLPTHAGLMLLCIQPCLAEKHISLVIHPKIRGPDHASKLYEVPGTMKFFKEIKKSILTFKTFFVQRSCGWCVNIAVQNRDFQT